MCYKPRIELDEIKILRSLNLRTYQAPLNVPIFYPYQLERFMRKLDNQSSSLSGLHKRLAD